MVSSVRLEDGHEEHGPVDKYDIVFYLVMLVGFGVLMPWNMFITIAPDFYVNYWFTPNGTSTWYSREFMSSLTIASQLPNATINIINLFLVIGGPLIYRVFAPVCFNLVNVGAVLLLVIFVDPSLDAMKWFFWATIGIVMSINISNGLYENSVFGVFADFPHRYTGALLIGNNLCGLLVTIISILVTILIPNDVRLTAVAYFSISLAILVLCAVALYSITRQEFYHYHHTKGIEIREKADTQKPSLSILWISFKSSAAQLYNVWFTFAVTLTIFPVMMSATSKGTGGFLDRYLPENLYTLITTFLVFNVFSTIGSIIASKIHWPTPRYLSIAVTLRAIFIPFFFYCNYRVDDRVHPVYFKTSEAFVFGGIIMSFTNGYFSSLAMSYCPKIVPTHLSRFAAQLSACCLMFGLFTGAIFSLLIGNFVTARNIF